MTISDAHINANNETDQSHDSVLTRIAQGDETAVEECVAKYSGLIAYIGRRSTADASELEDAVQEVLISVWMNAHRFDRSRGRESTFISTIARRHFIDRHRRRRSRPDCSRLTSEMETRLADRQYHEAGNSTTVATQLMERVTPRERSVLELMFAHDLSIANTAEALDMPVGTVKSIAYRGLNRLRRMPSALAA